MKQKNINLIGIMVQLLIVAIVTSYMVYGGGILHTTCLVIGISLNSIFVFAYLLALLAIIVIIFDSGNIPNRDKFIKDMKKNGRWYKILLGFIVSILFLYAGFTVIGTMLLVFNIIGGLLIAFVKLIIKNLEEDDQS